MNCTLIKPTANRLLLAPCDVSETQGSIFIPEAHREKTQEFIVLAVGPKRQLSGELVNMTEIRPGNKVLAYRYSSSEVDFNGKKAHLVTLNDIMAVLG